MRDSSRVQRPELIVLSESIWREWSGELPDYEDVIVVPDALFADLSATESPQGVLAIVPMPSWHPVRPAPMLTVVADGIQDPGNLGTMIRSAAASGASQLLCTPGTVDPYNPKVVRAATGLQLLVPIRVVHDLTPELDGSAIYVAEGRAETPIDQVDWTKPSSVIIGSEARGAGDNARRLNPTPVMIPMLDAVDSLNAGVAASIILYEAARQNRQHDRTAVMTARQHQSP